MTIPFNFLLEDVGNSASNESKSLSISERVTLIPSQRNVLSYLVSHPQALLQDVALECELSLGEVRKITSKMEKVGALERIGAKNKSTWIVKAQLWVKCDVACGFDVALVIPLLRNWLPLL